VVFCIIFLFCIFYIVVIVHVFFLRLNFLVNYHLIIDIIDVLFVKFDSNHYPLERAMKSWLNVFSLGKASPSNNSDSVAVSVFS